MNLTIESIKGTQTWGGRLAERLEAQQAATVEPEVRLVDDWLRSEFVLVLFHSAPPAIVLSRTFGARSLDTARSVADSWELNNYRRVFLIDKKFQGGLSRAEEAELEELQAEHGAFLDAIQPLPFDKLEKLEAFARNLNPNPTPPPP